MNLPGVGKIIINQLKDEGLKISHLSNEKFEQTIQVLRNSYNGLNGSTDKINALFISPEDKIILNKNASILLEYLLLHEVIHSIRANSRMNRMNKKSRMHDSMKLMLKDTAKAYQHKEIVYKSMCEKATNDLVYWREESIADCLSIFFCTKYGSKTRRSKIDTGRLVFIPLKFEDVYNEEDKKNFIELVRKECIITLEYICKYYLGELYDKKLIVDTFNLFIDEEVLYCLKQIKKTCQKKKKN